MKAPSGVASLSPGMKVELTSDEEKKLLDYLCREHEEALDAHQTLEGKLNEWERSYLAEPKQKQRNFPWPGSCNLEVPLIGFTVDSIVARIANTIFSVDPFWTVRPLRKEVDALAKPTEHYLDWSRKHEFDLYAAAKPCIIQTTKFGWSWLKYGWEVYTRRDYYLAENGEVQFINELVRRPIVYHIPNRDIILQAGVDNEHMSEFLTHRVRLTDNQMRMRKVDNIYDKESVDFVMARKDVEMDNYQYLDDQQNKALVRNSKINTIFETYVGWPYRGDAPLELIVTWHMPTKKILRAIFNPYPWRPFTKPTFIELEERLEGLGIARRLYQLQEEISTIHRQGVDNSTVANTRFWAVKRGQVRPGTQIWPGRLLPLGNPQTDIQALQMADLYPSNRQLEIQALGYAERASGISDPQLGREAQMPSRATATGTLAMIQEGNRRFDLNVRDIRESLSQVGKRILEINQRFRPRGISYFVEGEDGQYVEQVLDMPPEFSASKLAVELTASTATINKETEKQGLIGLLGVMSQYYERLVQGSLMLADPNIPPGTKEMVSKSSESVKYILDKIIQDFDVRDVEKVVPTLMNVEAINELQGELAPPGSPGMLAGGGGLPGVQPPVPTNPAMDMGSPGTTGGGV